MEVLDPEIEQIDGCMYRINPIAGFNYGIDVSDAHYEEFGVLYLNICTYLHLTYIHIILLRVLLSPFCIPFVIMHY